jgi:hypothetical protein
MQTTLEASRFERTTPRGTPAEEEAQTLRAAAAWLRLAADAIDEGRLDDADGFAHLGMFGCDGARERIAALRVPAVTS